MRHRETVAERGNAFVYARGARVEGERGEQQGHRAKWPHDIPSRNDSLQRVPPTDSRSAYLPPSDSSDVHFTVDDIAVPRTLALSR